MKRLLFVLAALPVFVSFVRAQEKPPAINLSVIHNGHEKSVPKVIVLTLDTRTENLLVQDDKIYVPLIFAHASVFSLVTVIDRQQIHIPDLTPRELQYENWTIVMADKQYEERYRALVPQGEEVKSSCILVLTSATAPPVPPTFFPDCRVKKEQPQTRRPSDVPIHKE